MREEVRRLIAQAERDLENADGNIGISAYEVAAFLCQQAVEKLLKALWIETRRQAPPFTHNLLDLARPFGPSAEAERKLFYLNLDYTVARYPDAANGIPYEQYNEVIAREKLGAAREVFEWLRCIATGTH